VAIAGVLLGFCYLIVPSVAAMPFAERIGARRAIGWTTGARILPLGVYLSVILDPPSGARIVCTFGRILLISCSSSTSGSAMLTGWWNPCGRKELGDRRARAETEGSAPQIAAS